MNARVLILSADVGEGHRSASRALAERLGALGVQVTERDGLAVLGPLTRLVMRDGYRLQLRVAPWSYGLVYRVMIRFGPARAIGAAVLSLLGRRRLLRLIARVKPDVVVSTHPALTGVLGRQRRRARLDVPLVATITDLADYEVWSHPGVDTHLVMHSHGIVPVEAVAGPGSATLVTPLVAPRFHAVRDRTQARRTLGLPVTGTVVAVSGGGWGVGDLAGGCSGALEAGADTVVVVAGHNRSAERALRRQFAHDPNVAVWGFTPHMDELMRAADAIVHSTGGVTSLEALACGCPMVAYGSSTGHIGTHNRTMEALGLILVAESREALRATLVERIASSASPWSPSPQAADAAAVVVAARRRSRPMPGWSVAIERAFAPLVCGAMLYAGLATDDAYSLVARPLRVHPLTHVRADRGAVGLVVRSSPSVAPVVARRLARAGVHASFAVPVASAARMSPRLRQLGDEVLPELPGPAPVRWLRTVGALRHAPRVGGAHLYLMPEHGQSFGQYLLGRSVGGRAVAGRERISAAELAGAPLPAVGDVVVVDAGAPSSARAVVALTTRLSRAGIASESIGALLSSKTSDRTAGERSSVSAQPTTIAMPTSVAGA